MIQYRMSFVYSAIEIVLKSKIRSNRADSIVLRVTESWSGSIAKKRDLKREDKQAERA